MAGARTFADTDPAARAAIMANLATIGVVERANVGPGAERSATSPPRCGRYDLVLLDPP